MPHLTLPALPASPSFYVSLAIAAIALLLLVLGGFSFMSMVEGLPGSPPHGSHHVARRERPAVEVAAGGLPA